MMYDIRTDDDRAAIVAVNTPGSTLKLTLPTYPIRGWHVIGQVLYVVSGQVLYRVNSDGTYYSIGTLPTTITYVGMADNTIQLIIVDGVVGYIYTLSTGVLTTISDVNFPNGATSVAFLNSRFIANIYNTRKFAVSQALDGTNWSDPIGSAQVYGTKENYSDLLQDVEVYAGMLLLWGQYSIEMWQDVGSTPLPYARINGATQSWGLAAKYSHVELGNSVIFLGANPDGGLRVMKLTGTSLSPISTSDEEYIISNLSATADAVALSYVAYGHSIYQLTFPSANISLAYDLTTGIWHQAQTGNSLQGRHYGNLGVVYLGKNYISDYSTGAIYLLDEDTYLDNGVPVPREICTRHIRNNGNKIFLSELFLDVDVGVGTPSIPNPNLFISISRDGGKTFGPEKIKPLGAAGNYLTRVRYARLGSGYDLVVKIRMTDAVKFIVMKGSAVIQSTDG